MTSALRRHARRVGAVLLACALALLAGIPALAQERPRLHIAFTPQTITDVDAKDADAAFRIWLRQIGDSVNFSTQSRLYERLPDLVRDFNAKELDFLALTSAQYMRIRADVDAVPGLTPFRWSRRTAIRYQMLVRTDAPWTTLKDLRSKRLALLRTDELGDLFLEARLSQANLPEVERFFGGVDRRQKSSQAILATFFAQADAALATDVTLRTLVELNPQVGQRLRPLLESEDLLPFVCVFRRDYPEAHKQIVLQQAAALRETPRGRQVLTLFKMDGMVPYTEADLENVRTLWAGHTSARRGG